MDPLSLIVGGAIGLVVGAIGTLLLAAYVGGAR